MLPPTAPTYTLKDSMKDMPIFSAVCLHSMVLFTFNQAQAAVYLLLLSSGKSK